MYSDGSMKGHMVEKESQLGTPLAKSSAIKIQKRTRMFIVLIGVLLWLVFNILPFIPTFIEVNIYWGIIVAGALVLSILVVISLIRSEEGTKARKARLVFFGISLVSFGFALFDVLQFGLGFRGLKVSGDYPYIWIGDIPFVSLLASFSTGGLASVIERFLELQEKKEL